MEPLCCGHPCTMQAAIPEVLRNAVEWNAKTSEHEASAFRNMWFQKWLRRALELRASEKRLKASLDGDVASILRSKRLCLWKEMLHEYGYPDVGVLDEIQNGTVLTGEVPSTGLFNPTDKPASISEECLRENADGLFRSMVANVRSPRPRSQDSDTGRGGQRLAGGAPFPVRRAARKHSLKALCHRSRDQDATH